MAFVNLDEAELFASRYLAEHGLRVERFSKDEMRKSKTPDFRVFRQTELVAYCEAKLVQHDDWLDEQLDQAQPAELVGGLRPDPIFNRLTAHIHKAVQQFDAVNPNHNYPNFLVFANFDRQCGYNDLYGVLTGDFLGEHGIGERVYEQYARGRVMFDKFRVDVFVWWNGWEKVSRRTVHFSAEPRHYAKVCELLHSDPSRHRKVG